MGNTIHRAVECTTLDCPHFKTCCRMPSSIYYNEAGTVDVVIVGQGAGWQEEHAQRSWCGKAGQLLRNILRDIRQDHMWDYGICLTNTVRCRPTQEQDGKLVDRAPTSVELGFCMSYLYRDIIEMRPKVLLLMGGSAASAFGHNRSVTSLRGRLRTSMVLISTEDDLAIPTIVTFHPAGVLRQPNLGRDMRRDIELAFNKAKESQC